MPSLRLLNLSNNDLKITNRQQKSEDEILQVITILLKTSSPFDDAEHSLNDLIGASPSHGDAESDITMRLQVVNTILKDYYSVSEMSVLSIESDGVGQTFNIELFIEYTDGSFEQGTVEAS